MEHRVACFAKNFANLQFCAELSNVSLSLFCKNVRFAFFIPQKILERPSFRCHESLKCRVSNGMESHGLNLFLRMRENVEQGLGHLFITTSDSHFFSKTNLKQHIFKNKNAIKIIQIYCKCLEKLICVKITI